jgi:predicted metalloprotease with PDZ domain
MTAASFRILILATIAFTAAISCAAQSLKANISVLSSAPPRIKIEGESPAPAVDYSFLQTYAGAQGLGRRIEDFTLSDSAGKPIAVKQLAPGEYQAERPGAKWSYEVDLHPPDFPHDAAYVSWLTAERGLLLLKDLLPLPARASSAAPEPALELTLAIPAGWRVSTVEKSTAPGRYQLDQWSAAVFFLAPDQHQATTGVDAVNLTLVSSGQWAFADRDVMDLTRDILKYHQRTVGDNTKFDAMLIVAPFPANVGADQWSAETRGRTVVLLSGRMPAKSAALAKLSVSLTHELFHLWIPNRLRLDGDYAWFYEGFTLYQALRCGVELGYFTFNDLLNALGRAYDAYRRTPQFDQLSLVQAGERRWTGGNALVYNKGMLAAFLLDARLRSGGGKASLGTVYRGLLQNHGLNKPPAPAGATLVAELQKNKELTELVRTLIADSAPIDLRRSIAPYGLNLEETGARSVLSVAPGLSRSQRDLLREFGYNS